MVHWVKKGRMGRVAVHLSRFHSFWERQMQKIGPGLLIAERYRLIEQIGEGGMGQVYLADDVLLSRKVAIKTVRPDIQDAHEVTQRIDRECRFHAQLGVQPNIVALYDKLVVDEQVYLIMEYVEGVPLDSLLVQNQDDTTVLPLEEGLSIVDQVLKGLHCIHSHGMVHHDVKPANILLHQQPAGNYQAKLMDFGIAALSEAASSSSLQQDHSGGVPGTPTYMAPECVDSTTFAEVGAPADLYAVGVILYQLLAGRPPFTGSTAEILNSHISKIPDTGPIASNGNQGLCEVVNKALQKEPHLRYQSALAFSSALTDAVSLGKVEDPGPISRVEHRLTEKTLLAARLPRSGWQSAVSRPATNSASLPLPSRARKKTALAACIVLIVLTVSFSWYFLIRPPATANIAAPGEVTEGTDLPANGNNRIAAPDGMPGVQEGGGTEPSSTQGGTVTEYRLAPPATSGEPPQEEDSRPRYAAEEGQRAEDSFKVFQAARQKKLKQQVAAKSDAADRASANASVEPMAPPPAAVSDGGPPGSEWKVVDKYSRKISP